MRTYSANGIPKAILIAPLSLPVGALLNIPGYFHINNK
jgi:hypothetical protein